MLVLGELTDLLESDVGLNWLNVAFALPFALIAVAGVAVGGDVFLEAIERLRGRRAGRGLATAMLAGVGFGSAIEIALHHVRQAPHLDASLGLAGGAVLLIAAGLHRHASASLGKNSPALQANHLRARPPASGSSRSRRVRRIGRPGFRSLHRTELEEDFAYRTSQRDLPARRYRRAPAGSPRPST